MMAEIEKLMNGVGGSFNYKIVNLGGKSVYIEGIKSIVELSENSMQFQLKKQVLCVVGNNMKVNYLDTSTCVLVGDIKAVEVK